MPLLHEPAVRDDLYARVEALSPDARRRWGIMEVDQMLWHLNSGLELSLGGISCEPQDNFFTRNVVKRAVLYGPWPKGRVATLKELTAMARYDPRGRAATSAGIDRDLRGAGAVNALAPSSAVRGDERPGKQPSASTPHRFPPAAVRRLSGSTSLVDHSHTSQAAQPSGFSRPCVPPARRPESPARARSRRR
jgi:hypothetical protein